MEYKDFIGKEVFVLGPDSVMGETGVVHIFESMAELIAHLLSIDVSTDTSDMKDMRILHGYLTSADVLPSDFGDRQPFLVVQEPYDDDAGILLESTADDSEALAYEIEGLIDNPQTDLSGGPDLTNLEISNIHILYGYEVSIRFAFDLDDINEKSIRECKMIAAEVNQIKERNKTEIDED